MMGYHEFNNRQLVTRKPHRCEWCDEVLPVGSTVHYRCYVIDGEFRTGWMHLECWDAMGSMDYRDLEEGWQPGDFKRGTTGE
jgi:hypothetical protein